MKKSLIFTALIFAVLFTAQSFAANFSKRYTHYSTGENITSVLTDFAKAQGMGSSIAPDVTGKISGRFDKVKPNEFLKGMNAAFNVSYYVLANTIYFYNQSSESRSVYKPSTMEPNALIDSLNSAGVIASELPVKIDSNGMLIINGPDSYVKTIVELAKSFDRDQERQVVMEVFRLKHAKADDYQFTNSDKTVIVPGVASILDKMVSGSTGKNASVSVTINSPKMQGLSGTGLASVGNNQTNVTTQSDETTSSGFTPNITSSKRLNAVIVNDYRYRMPFYKKVIDELDVPVKLVELHAAIIDVDVDATRSLGIDWSAAKKTGNWNIGGASGVNTPAIPANGNGGGIFSTVFNSSRSNFMMQVNMLEADNKAKTLGRPSILTFDNEEAVLEDTTTSYIKVEGYQDSDLFQIVSGTVLRVTPHIIENNGESYIQMVISIQTNQDSGSSAQSTDEKIPTVKQTKINTQAIVKQGQSLLLGGYYVENKTDGNRGVPGLKNIPLLGSLFSTDSASSYKRERLLMITPKILDLDEGNVPSSLDDVEFDKKPQDSSFELATPTKNNSSGCSSNRANAS